MLYVACKFRSEDTRSYTYTYDGEEPLAVGDQVKVPDRSGDGWKCVTVAAISDQAPPFACKPILGKFEPEPASEDAAEPDQPQRVPPVATGGDPLDAEIPW